MLYPFQKANPNAQDQDILFLFFTFIELNDRVENFRNSMKIWNT